MLTGEQYYFNTVQYMDIYSGLYSFIQLNYLGGANNFAKHTHINGKKCVAKLLANYCQCNIYEGGGFSSGVDGKSVPSFLPLKGCQ